jgi:hypothetical protein
VKTKGLKMKKNKPGIKKTWGGSEFQEFANGDR